MVEAILPKNKKIKIEFECKRCHSNLYIDKAGYDHYSQKIDCRICKQCGTRYMKYQNQFVDIPLNKYIKI